MQHKMTLGAAQICPECGGHKRVVCECVTRDANAPVEELIGAVGCPSCEGDGDHWCSICMGNGAVPRPQPCTCDENCDDPCPNCHRPTVQAAKTAYSMGRKDARRYASQSVGAAHTDTQTIERFAAMAHSIAEGDDAIPFENLSKTNQTKLKMLVQEMLSAIGAAVLRHLDAAPKDPVSFEAIANAAEVSIFDGKHEDPCVLGHE